MVREDFTPYAFWTTSATELLLQPLQSCSGSSPKSIGSKIISYRGVPSNFVEVNTLDHFIKSFESQGQPVYATLNTVRNQGNENQPVRNGPIRLSIPKSGTTTAKIVTNNRTYQGGNVVSQPIRVQLRQPSSNQNSSQSSNQGSSGTRTIIQTVQMPRSQQQAQRNRFSL